MKDNRILLIGEPSMGSPYQEKSTAHYNQKFGDGNWEQKWFFGEKFSDMQTVLSLYEDGYYKHFKNHPEILEWLINTAQEIYDINPSDIESGLDYKIQQQISNHFQDIAIRRAITRISLEENRNEFDKDNLPEIEIFKGNHLMQIRGYFSEGYKLNPGRVPFHDSNLLSGIYLEQSWWKEGSIEDFYQRAKALIVNPENIMLAKVIEGLSESYFQFSKKFYYKMDHANPHTLYILNGKTARRKISIKNRNGLKKIPYPKIQPYSKILSP